MLGGVLVDELDVVVGQAHTQLHDTMLPWYDKDYYLVPTR